MALTMSDLEPISPKHAVDLYLKQRKPEVSTKTLQNQKYRLDRFLEWAEENDLEDMRDLTGRNLHEYRTWRSERVKTVTLRGELQTFRVFLEFCASIDAVEPGMRERVLLPDIDPEDEARDEKLEEEDAQQVLDHLERYEYASRNHVIMAILWHTGIRLGALRALDVDDFDAEDQCLELRHRPETDTPLKNGQAAERDISVGDHYSEVIQDYIDVNRLDAHDEYGRAPLITSDQGRYSSAPIRLRVYEMTRPCLYTECPHDRDPATCEAMEPRQASKCPSSRSPHGVRRGAITYALRESVPEEVVQDRMNVSGGVLDQHYDQRTEREKMEVRRQFLEGLE